MWAQPYRKYDVEAGVTRPLYPMMLESPELRWAFIRKIYSIIAIQLLATIAVAAAVVSVRPISIFFTTTGAGLALYILLIITPFIVLFPLYYYYQKHPVNYLLLGIFTTSLAFAVGLTCAFTKGEIILESAILTAVVVISLTLYTFWAASRGHDFNFLGPFLFGAIMILLVFSFIQILFPLGRISVMIYGCLASIIFCGYIIYDGILPILVKTVKKKSDLPVRERIFLLLDATQTSLGGASGKFPQYYTVYYELVSSGVQFPPRPRTIPSNHPSSDANKKTTLNGELAASRHEGVPVPLAQQPEPQIVSESSIIQKASNALEVLKEVLDAVDTQNPEGAKDEFTLDIVEQCSFQKQRVMHLVMTSWDEKVVSRAIDLNEQLQNVLARHDALLSGRPVNHQDGYLSTRSTLTANHADHEQEEEEEAEQLFRRIRKGKACARPEDEDQLAERPPLGFLGSSIPAERLNRPLIRPVQAEPPHENNAHFPPVTIPPPPAKHVEREKFFQEKKVDPSAVAGHMRGLSLHSPNASSSRSGSIDFSD